MTAGRRRVTPAALSLTLAAAGLLLSAAIRADGADAAGPRVFATPEDAVRALIATVKSKDPGALVAFLICESCGAVGEAPGSDVGRILAAAARSADFAPKSSVVEITGLCAHCREQSAAR